MCRDLDWRRFLVATFDAGIVGAVQLRQHADTSRELGSLVVEAPSPIVPNYALGQIIGGFLALLCGPRSKSAGACARALIRRHPRVDGLGQEALGRY
jgi:hypothetical protein